MTDVDVPDDPLAELAAAASALGPVLVPPGSHELLAAITDTAHRLFGAVAVSIARVDESAGVIQEAIVTPAREGLALVAGIRAGLAALRSLRDLRGRPARAEDEDALFIG